MVLQTLFCTFFSSKKIILSHIKSPKVTWYTHRLIKITLRNGIFFSFSSSYRKYATRKLHGYYVLSVMCHSRYNILIRVTYYTFTTLYCLCYNIFWYDYVSMCVNKLLLPERDASEAWSIEHATLIVPVHFIVVL